MHSFHVLLTCRLRTCCALAAQSNFHSMSNIHTVCIASSDRAFKNASASLSPPFCPYSTIYALDLKTLVWRRVQPRKPGPRSPRVAMQTGSSCWRHYLLAYKGGAKVWAFDMQQEQWETWKGRWPAGSLPPREHAYMHDNCCACVSGVSAGSHVQG